MSKNQTPAFCVLIPAAGTGTRTGLAIPKQYQQIGGKSILRHTIEKFVGIQGLKSLQVIIDPAHMALYLESVKGLDLPAPLFGGASRQESIFNGLSAFVKEDGEDIVLIHDAARPLVSRSLIQSLLEAMKTNNAATLATSMADTLVDPSYNPLERDKVNAIQTPQAFRIGTLKKAHEFFKDDNRFTDDAGLVAAMGERIAIVPGSRENFKITTAEDIRLVQQLLMSTSETRTGFGFDVHAFDSNPADKIRLCGIDIPYHKKLLGHSDADVILHALTDAVLGAIGEGDIGQLFPPSDMTWKNADSTIFLTEALRRLQKKGGIITNVDITVIAEEPKIGPHREAMLKRLSDTLGIKSSRIGLKATTSEGLGFTGRKEGIAAQAIATITMPPREEECV